MSNENDYTFYCRICGLKQIEPPWGLSGKEPNYDYCSCCNVEFGYQDFELDAIRTYRNQWLQKGGNWFEINEKPKNWSLDDQLKNIPPQFL